MIASVACSKGTMLQLSGHSPAIAQPLEIGFDLAIQPVAFSEAVPELGCEFFHFLLEWFSVALGLGKTDIAAWRQNVSMLFDVVERYRLAETWDVLIGARAFFTAPGIFTSACFFTGFSTCFCLSAP